MKVYQAKIIQLVFFCSFAGNHYGTPKPPPESNTSLIRGPTAAGSGNDPRAASGSSASASAVNAPGAHPSSEGKRRRNRSNVEAMTAKHLLADEDDEQVVVGNSGDVSNLNHNHHGGNVGDLKSEEDAHHNHHQQTNGKNDSEIMASSRLMFRSAINAPGDFAIAKCTFCPTFLSCVRSFFHHLLAIFAVIFPSAGTSIQRVTTASDLKTCLLFQRVDHFIPRSNFILFACFLRNRIVVKWAQSSNGKKPQRSG